MQSIQDILIQMAKNDPTIQMAIKQAQETTPHNLQVSPQTLPEEVKQVLAKKPLINQVLPYYIVVYWPKIYPVEAEGLILDMCDRFGGVTCSHDCHDGMWKSPEEELIRDQIMLLKSFTDAQTIVQQLEIFLTQVAYWGRVANQIEVAVEIGANQSLLLIPGV
jgi:hypothetical protein